MTNRLFAEGSCIRGNLSHFIYPPRTRPESETVLEWRRPCVAHRYLAPFHTPQPVGWGEALLASIVCDPRAGTKCTGACGYFPEHYSAAWGRVERAFVSYWELVKLIATAVLISIGMIAFAFSFAMK